MKIAPFSNVNFSNSSHGKTNTTNESFLKKNKENIKKYGNIAHIGIMGVSLLYAGNQAIKIAKNNVSKQRELLENTKTAGAVALFLTAFLTFIPKFDNYIEEKLNLPKN